MTEVVRTRSEDETAAVAARVAAGLEPGAVVLLTGDLGAGKTAFVRGMAEGLGIDPEEISSPTFTLVQEYRVTAEHPSREPESGGGRDHANTADPRSASARGLWHVDLYRLDGGEVDDLGLEELGAGAGVVAIEWAEKLGAPPPGAVRVAITDLGGDDREIRIERPAGARR
jgi:tRNA threonylcarbamoyladenosine biosynthesis protein TsaE